MQGNPRLAAARHLVALAMLLGLLAGCTVAPVQPAPASPAAQAQQLAQQGQYLRAAQLYERLAASSQGEQHNQDLVSAAEAYWQARQGTQTWRVLGQVPARGLSATLTARVGLLKAEMDFTAHHAPAALGRLQYPLASLPAELKASTLLLRAQIEATLNNLVAAVTDLSEREDYLGGNRNAIHANHELIWKTITQSRAPIDVLKLPTDTSSTVRGWLTLGSLIRNIWQQPRNLLAQLQAWQTQYPGHPANQDIVPQLIANQRAFVTYPTQVAVLLPLSGQYESLADAVRNGLLTAYFQLANQGGAPGIVFYDAQATARGAQDAYRKAVADGATMVVGPLIKDAVGGIAALGSLPVPVLALNTLDGTRPPPAGLFQFGLPPEPEAEQVAERVVAVGMTRGLALVPESDWGKRVLNAFSTRFQQLGGSLLGTELYNPGASDFSVPITRLLNINDSQYRKNQLQAVLGQALQFESRRRQDAQFIFLAADSEDAKLIRPELRFYHAINLPVYSTSQVYEPGHAADTDFDGITFDDMPWTLETTGAAAATSKQVATLWPNGFSSDSRLYALGFDAWRLVPLLYKGQPFTTSVQGMTGLLSMGANGHVHRELDWATFKNGIPQLLAPIYPANPAAIAGSSSGIEP
ncbi:MAG: penicillin-binding protein activator [Gammaproteobacteria bacterium]